MLRSPRCSPSRVLLGCAAAAIVAGSAAPVQAEVVWEPDPPTLLTTGWDSWEAVDLTRFGGPVAPAVEPFPRYRVTVRPGDSRGPTGCGHDCERSQLNAPYLAVEGEEQYTAVAIRVPASYPPAAPEDHAFQTTWQWHGAPFGYSPPIALNIAADASAFEVWHSWFPGADGVREGTQKYDRIATIPLEKGRWQRFVWRMRWSRWDERASTELWHAGEGEELRPVAFAGGSARRRGANLGADMPSVQAKASNYRTADVLPRTTIEFAGVRVATTFAEAAAGFPAEVAGGAGG